MFRFVRAVRSGAVPHEAVGRCCSARLAGGRAAGTTSAAEGRDWGGLRYGVASRIERAGGPVLRDMATGERTGLRVCSHTWGRGCRRRVSVCRGVP